MTIPERAEALRRRLFPLSEKQTPMTLDAISWVDCVIKAALDAAVSEEREACAQLAEDKYGEFCSPHYQCASEGIAAEIRKRGGQ